MHAYMNTRVETTSLAMAGYQIWELLPYTTRVCYAFWTSAPPGTLSAGGIKGTAATFADSAKKGRLA